MLLVFFSGIDSFPVVKVPYASYLWATNTWWLKASEIYSLTILEARSLKSISLSQYQCFKKATVSLEALGENLFLAFSGF